MKYVLISLAEAGKLDFTGAERLGKADHLVCVHAKGKKTLSAKLKETFSEISAVIDYFEVGAATEIWMGIAYLIGQHTATTHDVYVLTEDKDKLPSKITKDIKVYSAMKSITGGSATKSTAKKSSSTTKKTTTKKTTTAKKTTVKKSTSAAKKTTAKKTTAKKTSTKKKDEGVNVSSILKSLQKGDTSKLSKQISDLAGGLLK